MRLVLPVCAAVALSVSAALAQQPPGMIPMPPGVVPGGAQTTAPAPVQGAAPAPAPRVAQPAASYAAPARAPTNVPLPTPAPLQKSNAPVQAAQAAPAQTAPIAQAPAAAPATPVQVAAAGPRSQKAAGATIERINNYFNSFKTMIGTFVQVDPDGTRKQGQFYILKPGRVLFEYDPPSQIVLVADGRSVSVRDKRLKTQDISPLSATPLRFLLSENLDLARNGNVTGVYQDDVFATVVMEEKQPMAGTYRLMIMFDAKTLQLKQWTVTDPQGYDTTVAVYNLNTSERPDPMMFVINRN